MSRKEIFLSLCFHDPDIAEYAQRNKLEQKQKNIVISSTSMSSYHLVQ